jgi:hypothetical protein
MTTFRASAGDAEMKLGDAGATSPVDPSPTDTTNGLPQHERSAVLIGGCSDVKQKARSDPR